MTYSHDPYCNSSHQATSQPCPVSEPPSWKIQRADRPWYTFPYIVFDPEGFVVAARGTLWGAKRALRYERRKRQGDKRKTTVYSEPTRFGEHLLKPKRVPRLPGEVNFPGKVDQ